MRFFIFGRVLDEGPESSLKYAKTYFFNLVQNI